MTTKKINELMATVKSYTSENITIDYLDTIANFARIGIIIHDKNDANKTKRGTNHEYYRN